MLDSHRQSLMRDLIRARDAHVRALASTPVGCSPGDERSYAYALAELRWWWAQEPRMPGVRAAMREHYTWTRWSDEFEEDDADDCD